MRGKRRRPGLLKDRAILLTYPAPASRPAGIIHESLREGRLNFAVISPLISRLPTGKGRGIPNPASAGPGRMARSKGEESPPGGQCNGLGAALGVKLAHDGIHVELDGVLAHSQSGGDSLVWQSLGQKPQDVLLPGSQQRGRTGFGSGWSGAAGQGRVGHPKPIGQRHYCGG